MTPDDRAPGFAAAARFRKLIMALGSVQAISWWLVAAGTLIGVGAWVGGGVGSIPAFDREGLILAHAWRSPLFDAAFAVLTRIGSLIVLLPLVLVVGMRLWRRGFRGEAGFLIAALVGASAWAHLAKHLAMRPRPDLYPALAAVASPLSFPSIHAVQVTTVAVASWVIVNRLTPWRRHWLAPALVPMVALVGFSRFYLQVHYPSDVLAGTLSAAFWVAGLRAFVFAGRVVPCRQ